MAEVRAQRSLTPKRQGRAPGTVGKLAPHILFLVEVVQAEPDITLRELSSALSGTYGVTVELSSIHRALVRAGLSYKKGLIAQERGRANLRHIRHDWLTRRQPRLRAESHRLVFIDETAVKTNMTRQRGRSIRGERLFGIAPFGKWQTQMLICTQK